ncbi:MAG: response regulator [bacterium]|nr:response regulator [bacterium]
MNDHFDENVELIQGFIEESHELLRHAEDDALVLEKNPDDQARINRVFRSFHTIKGNAGFLKFPKITGFAHESENLLSRIREGNLKITTEISNLLFHIIDRIKLMLKEPRNSENIETAELEKNIRTLLRVEAEGVRQKVRYLIAEDEIVQQEILKLMLEDDGEFDVACNGREAVEKFREALDDIPYFIVFMDILMPEMNGIEAVTRIRQIEKERGIPLLDEVTIVMVTIQEDIGMIFKAHYEAGATIYLNKPVSSNRLKDIISAKKKGPGN